MKLSVMFSFILYFLLSSPSVKMSQTRQPAYGSQLFKKEQMSTFLEVARPGDLIEFYRSGYQHWGVFLGEVDDDDNNPQPQIAHRGAQRGYVSHHLFTRSEIVSKGAKGVGRTMKWSLFDVAKDDYFRINNYNDKHYNVLPTQEILDRCRAPDEGEYNFVTNNCESFAMYARYGVTVSDQSFVLTLYIVFTFLMMCYIVPLLCVVVQPQVNWWVFHLVRAVAAWAVFIILVIIMYIIMNKVLPTYPRLALSVVAVLCVILVRIIPPSYPTIPDKTAMWFFISWFILYNMIPMVIALESTIVLAIILGLFSCFHSPPDTSSLNIARILMSVLVGCGYGIPFLFRNLSLTSTFIMFLVSSMCMDITNGIVTTAHQYMSALSVLWLVFGFCATVCSVWPPHLNNVEHIMARRIVPALVIIANLVSFE